MSTEPVYLIVYTVYTSTSVLIPVTPVSMSTEPVSLTAVMPDLYMSAPVSNHHHMSATVNRVSEANNIVLIPSHASVSRAI